MDKAFLLWMVMIFIECILLLIIILRLTFNRDIGKKLLQATIAWTLICNTIKVLFLS